MISQEIKTGKIKDADEFCKLFKINIPVKEKFDYYINTLKKSDEYTELLSDEKFNAFSEFEQWLVDNNQGTVTSYKMRCLDILKEYIQGTKAYTILQEHALPNSKAASRDWINQVDEKQMLVSLDFKSANYSILKTFDYENELKVDWKDLCNHLNIHHVLASSKNFRQLVFGNTNPKRLQTFQHQKIDKIVETLKTTYCLSDEDFVFISHDEVVVKLSIGFEKKLDDIVKKLEELVQMSIRRTFYSLKKIKKGVFVKTIFYMQDFCLHKKYDSLHGVPGNKFFMYFKKYILQQPCLELDLLYYNDGELCQWIDEDVRQKNKLPHYDKPASVVSLKDAMRDYSYVWDELTKVLPNLSNEEKRRIIETLANTCKYCFQAPYGCQCWNDD